MKIQETIYCPLRQYPGYFSNNESVLKIFERDYVHFPKGGKEGERGEESTRFTSTRGR